VVTGVHCGASTASYSTRGSLWGRGMPPLNEHANLRELRGENGNSLRQRIMSSESESGSWRVPATNTTDDKPAQVAMIGAAW
jgi:hypothetical protein